VYDYARLELNLRPEAARYEGGSQNIVGMFGLGASLDWLASFGLSSSHSPLASRVVEITDAACEALQKAGATIYSDRRPAHRSGIVSFTFPDADHQLLRKRCLQAGVVLSCRDSRLRISPHAYANSDDLSRLVDALQTGLRAH
jgi:selenocysteine lyase/cysteine desulfurase